MEAAQWGPVQSQEISHILSYPFSVTQEFWLLPQPHCLTQMTLSESPETLQKHWDAGLQDSSGSWEQERHWLSWNSCRITGKQSPPEPATYETGPLEEDF